MSDENAKQGRAYEFVIGQSWAILEESLDTIASIAQRTNEDPEAVAAKLGRPLKNTQSVEMRDGVAVIPVNGPIMRYANWMTQISGATSIQMLATDFTKAIEDPSVKSIVLEVDSPGGTTSGVSEFANMVYEARGKKPIVAYVSDMGASAAYWIASAADQIVVNDTARVGSIGTIITYDKNSNKNVGQIVSSQSPKKSPDITTDEGKAQIQAMVDSLSEVFVSTVARNRNVDPETVLSDFGQGGMFVGKDAVSAGLADKIGSLEGVIADLKKSKASNQSNNGGKITMSVENQTQAITRELILASHPEIAESFRAEGRIQGAENERKRIQAVEEQNMPGHEALIAELKFDGTTSGPEAAVKVLAAEKQKNSNYLQNLKNDAPKPAPVSEAPAVTTSDKPKAAVEDESDEETKARCEENWKNVPSLREEFINVDGYIAFEKANKKGLVRIKSDRYK